MTKKRASNRSRSAKIAISLPGGLLADLERLRRKTGESRSALIQRAVRQALNASVGSRARRYVEGYRRRPETDREIAAAEASATALLASEPWE